MSRLVASIKPLLLPVWNGAHRLAWSIGEIAGALAHGRVERCVVCGRVGLMLRRPRAIPDRLADLWGLGPRLRAALVRKETDICSRCGAQARVRRLVRAMLEIGVGGMSATSAAGWVRMPETIPLRIAEINRIEGLHDQLAILPGLHASDFIPGAEPGSTVDGVRHEDLTRLTYADASFDLVLTSETLEHVPDLDRALSEIRRVLVPGGFHLFTIPLLPTQLRTFARARLDDAGRRIELAPPLAHPGGDWGYPVFTEFGLDAVERLRAAGFETEMRYGPVTEDDLLQVFVTRRPMN